MPHPYPISCNEYPWQTFYRRAGRNAQDEIDAILRAVAEAGFGAFEPLVRTPDQLEALRVPLARYGLALPSVYVNSTLHDPELVEASIQDVLTTAAIAQRSGATIVVTNPSPIRWGGPETKRDPQLETQAAALDRLGAALRRMGLTLAYHNHDPELRNAAAEFHHMMLATDPDHVALCLDSHWIYRGAGDSQVALFDIVRLYGPRIVELHLRQSRTGIWLEAFGPGDIEYPRLAAMLAERQIRPHLVLEQAVEPGSAQTVEAAAAHSQGLAYLRAVFGA
jgi:inosose dehydratase